METNWTELAGDMGFVREPEETEEDFVERVQVTLMLMTARPVTLRDWCDCATIWAGRGAYVTGAEPGERRLALTVYVPHWRRLFAWQRRRIKHRVWQKCQEHRDVNFVITVTVAP